VHFNPNIDINKVIIYSESATNCSSILVPGGFFGKKVEGQLLE